MTAQMLAVLTPDQRAKFEKMQGVKLEIDVRRLTTAILAGRNSRASRPND
jgi:hypothetical protein